MQSSGKNQRRRYFGALDFREPFTLWAEKLVGPYNKICNVAAIKRPYRNSPWGFSFWVSRIRFLQHGASFRTGLNRLGGLASLTHRAQLPSQTAAGCGIGR